MTLNDPGGFDGLRFPVLVVDDHEMFATLLVASLQQRGHETHQCAFDSASDILAVAAALPPGLVLLDLDLGTDPSGQWIEGASLVADLCADGWSVIAVTGRLGTEALAAAVAGGATGVLLKTSGLRPLFDLVDQAAKGRLLMPAVERRRWSEEYRSSQDSSSTLDLLTPSERVVLSRLADGDRAMAIAASTGVSLSTVRTHIRSILSKLGVNSQLEAVARLKTAREHAAGRRR